MKKKVFISLLILIVAAIGVYKYIYKAHRDIAAEEASYTTTVDAIYVAFTQNDSTANAKYLDKTVAVKGMIYNIDVAEKIITVDDKLVTRFSENLPANLKVKDSVTIKGRVIGFDDLLEEIQMDQCTVTP